RVVLGLQLAHVGRAVLAQDRHGFLVELPALVGQARDGIGHRANGDGGGGLGSGRGSLCACGGLLGGVLARAPATARLGRFGAAGSVRLGRVIQALQEFGGGGVGI